MTLSNLRNNAPYLTAFFLFVLCLITISSFTSCKKDCFTKGSGPIVNQVFSVAEFNSVHLGVEGIVHVTQGPVQHLEVNGQQNILDRLSLKVKNGNLDIGFENYCGTTSYQTLEIYVTIPSVKALRISGSGTIETTNTVATDILNLDISGSGNISASVTAQSVIARISGSGNMNLSGTAIHSDVSISGSGNFFAFGLLTNSTEIDISGSGDAEVSVSDSLDVEINGSGNVRYKGQPVINSSLSGSGRIEHVG